MQELVGYCRECRKPIFCNDGFFTGILAEDKSLICFDCSDSEQPLMDQE